MTLPGVLADMIHVIDALPTIQTTIFFNNYCNYLESYKELDPSLSKSDPFEFVYMCQ